MNDICQTKPTTTSCLSGSDAWWRVFRASACALGLFVVMTSGFLTSSALTSTVAMAADDNQDEDEDSFEQKFITKLMSGLGAIDPRSSNGIDYRERSPLVVPPQLNLPPPETSRVNASNWPTDPEAIEQKKRKEAKRNKKRYYGGIPADDVAMPSELNAVGRAKVEASTKAEQPGMGPYKDTLLPSQLGSKSLLSNVFNIGGKTEETAKFKGEPPRESLVQPPAGYQTPSPNYAYGVTPEVNTAPPKDDKLMPSQLR